MINADVDITNNRLLMWTAIHLIFSRLFIHARILCLKRWRPSTEKWT